MIVGAISAIFGAVSGLLPDILKEWKAGREQAREIEHAQKMAEIQRDAAKANGDARLQEIDGTIARDQVAALKALIEAQARPTGILWVDAWNACIRPAAASAMLVLFFVVAAVYVGVVVGQVFEGAIDAQTMAQLIFGSMVGDLFMAWAAFMWGAREVRKK